MVIACSPAWMAATSGCSRAEAMTGRRGSNICASDRRAEAFERMDRWRDRDRVRTSRTDFQALQNAFDAAATADIHYLVFDLPYYADHDLRQVPLRNRNLLRQLMAANTSNYLKFSEDFEADAGSLLEAACYGLEGVIGKRADSPYVSTRSPTWIKLKCTRNGRSSSSAVIRIRKGPGPE